MSINDSKITFWTSSLSQSGLIDANVANGAFVYSTTDKALYLIDGARSEIGRAIHPISTIIPANSLPSTTDTAINEALYLYNNYLYFYDGSSMKKLLKDGDLTSYITDEVLTKKAYLTETELNTILAEKDYVKQSEITDFITADSLEGYAKSTDLSNYLTISNANSTYLKISDATNTYAKSTDLSNYLAKSEAESTYLTTVNADGKYATIAGLNNIGAIAQTNKTNITTVTGRVDTLDTDVDTIQGTVGTNESNIAELIEFTGYTAQDENDPTDRPSLAIRIASAESVIDNLDTNKLNKINGTSTNLTESSKFTIGTANSERIEITNSTINKYSGNSTNSTSVLFKGDVSVSNNDNTYTINDGNGHTITITIPADLVVKNGTVEEKTSDFTYNGVTYKAGTYIVLKLNNSEETLIYINATDLVDEYTADNSSDAPIQITINNRAISATLGDNSVTSQYLADDITLTSLIVPTIKGSDSASPATITINGATINSEGKYSGEAATATSLTDGKTITITGDVSGTISNVGTSNSSGLLTLATVNSSVNEDTSLAIIMPSIANNSSKNNVLINIPTFVANEKGLVTSASTTPVSIGAVNTVKKAENTGTAAKPIAFMAEDDPDNDTLLYNSGITITPSTKTITASTFDGNASTASAFNSDQKIKLTGAVTGEVSSAAGWTIGVTSNSKLISGSTALAVDNTTSATSNPYLNLYAPNADGTNTVSSSLQLKGSGATTISAANGIITITSTDYSNAIAAAQSNAINTASADATTKANAAQSNAINTASADATTKANAAQSVAISTASTDATNKANAAISAAATDAATKASVAAKTVWNQVIPAPAANEAGETIYPLLAREGIQIMTGEETLTKELTESYSLINAYLTHEGYLHATKVYGAVWNDYAEYRQTHNKVRPGQCVYEKGDGSLAISYERMMPGANIVSDTFGFAIGETDDCKTPLAVSGRVLAYPYEPKEEYKAGDAVCSGPNGTISKMTRAEIRDYPERIIGTVSEIPTYEVWGSGNVKVNGRIWIKVR